MIRKKILDQYRYTPKRPIRAYFRLNYFFQYIINFSTQSKIIIIEWLKKMFFHIFWGNHFLLINFALTVIIYIYKKIIDTNLHVIVSTLTHRPLVSAVCTLFKPIKKCFYIVN